MSKFFTRCTGMFVLLLALSTFLMAQGTTFTLLHLNDTHSHLDAIGPKDANLNGTLGGIARAATVIGTVRATEQNVILLHGGDLFVGDFFFNKYFGVPELQIMNQLGFDCMTVGNHEFDLGPGVLNDVLTTAFQGGSFPLISANLDMEGFPALKAWVRPSITKTMDGVTIGIFGLTVPNSPTSMTDPVVIREDIVPIAQQQVDSLRAAGAAAVICLSHLGFYLDKILGASVTGIDFIIGAHDHYLFKRPVPVTNPAGKQVLIFQAGEFYKNIGKLRFTVHNGTVTVDDYQMITIDSSIPPVPEIQALVDTLKAGIVQQYGDVYHKRIGTAVHELGKTYDTLSPLRDTPVGNLVTDAFRAKTGTEIAITPLGLISEKMYAGPIVGADVFRTMAYGYDQATGLGLTLATFQIQGSELLKGLEICLSQLEVGDDYFLQVSGMKYAYNPKRPVGHRVIEGSICIHGRPFHPRAKYTVTVDLGVVMLLDKLGITVENLQMLPDFEYTVLKDYIRHLGRVNYRAEGRIVDKSVHMCKDVPDNEMAAETVTGFALSPNYPNPFNPATTISYSLPQDAYVTLKVYNSLGQEVAVLVQGTVGAGEHQVQWNSGNLASGMYFYQLRSGTFTETKRMLLVR
jgi:5'-nucleotidase/UDP-sugar diphosphatase